MRDARHDYLETILPLLKSYSAVEGVILVGSASSGFPDKWSDIDMSVVIQPGYKAKEVWKNFNSKIVNALDTFYLHENIYSENNYLTLIFLRDFLELDIGFISLDNLVAKSQNWKIIYEKESKVVDKMHETSKTKDNHSEVSMLNNSKVALLYHSRNICVAINRKRPFRVIKELEDLRNDIVALWGEHTNLTTKHFRDVDNFERQVLELLAKTYPSTVSVHDLGESIYHLLYLYFYVYDSIADEKDSKDDLLNYIRGMFESFNTGIDLKFLKSSQHRS